MLIENMNCPRGCANATFLESTKTVPQPNSKMLLDSDGQQPQQARKVKVYTCNCCNNTFEIPERNSAGKHVL